MTTSVGNLYRDIVEQAPDAIIFADREGVIRLWNAGAEAVFGHTAEEAVGQSLDLIIPANLRPRHWEGYERVMGSGHTRYGAGEMLSVPALRKDGQRISCEFSIVPLHDEAGALTGIAAIMRDVTTRFNQDRDLRKQLAQLQAQLRPPEGARTATE